jgi:hypothetical protein
MAAPATADDKKDPLPGTIAAESPPDTGISELINASGHVQELERNFNLLSAAGVGLVVGSAWMTYCTYIDEWD